MESARWSRIQELFHAAADLPQEEQRGYLKSTCSGDEALFADVAALLDEDARASSPLDGGVARMAHDLLATEVFAAKELGAYRIERVLGEGGMGVVYLAERKDLGRRVAVKVLRDAWLSPGRRERFAAEQAALAQLEHPGIARLYEGGVLDDGTPFFVMEYVDGKPLTDHCRDEAATIDTRLRLFRSLCEAVQSAHAHAIIHRDIKPSNVLVKRDGNVRLLDFGIAKQLESFDAVVSQTVSGLRLMTPAYAAPEQFRGERVGIHTDVYSLGVVLYELLSGKLPFDLSRCTPSEAAAIVVGREPVKPSAAGGDAALASRSAWSDLDVLVLTAMHKDPRRRYRSVEALIRDVDHYLAGKPLEARPDSTSYRLRKFLQRNRGPVGASAAVLAAVVALVTIFTVGLAAARDAALAEADRRQRIETFMLGLFQGSGDKRNVSAELKIVTLLEEGKKEVSALAGHPETQADFQNALGKLFVELGKLDDADALLAAGLATRRLLPGPHEAALVESLTELSFLRGEQGKLEEAQQLAEEAVAIGRRHPDLGEPIATNAHIALANALRHRAAGAKAVETLEMVLQKRGSHPLPADTRAAVLGQLSTAHYDLGHYDEAENLEREAIALTTRAYGANHRLVADQTGLLADIAEARGRYDEGERLRRRSLEIDTAWFGAETPAVANDLSGLGSTLIRLKRLDEAQHILERALAIQEKTYGPDHFHVSQVLNVLGGVALRRGDLDLAEARFRRVAEMSRAVYGERHFTVAIALTNIGSVQLARKDFPEAEGTFRKAAQMCIETSSAESVACAIAEMKLGRAVLAQGRAADAEAPSLAAYRTFSKAGSVEGLGEARKDLVAIYQQLRNAAEAAKYRSELSK